MKSYFTNLNSSASVVIKFTQTDGPEWNLMAPTSEITRVTEYLMILGVWSCLVTYLIGNWEARASCYPLVICYIAIGNGHKK